MTLEGTNTWVLLEPGSTEAVVVDPGPLHLEHLETVLRFVESRGARVALTLLTHHHQDHAEAAEHFAAQTAAPVRAIGTRPRRPGRRRDGAGRRTGGHRRHDPRAYRRLGLVPAAGRVRAADRRHRPRPGHHRGGVAGRRARRIPRRRWSGSSGWRRPARRPGSCPATARWSPTRRPPSGSTSTTERERLDEVRAALAAGDTEPRQVVERVYADVPREVWPYAELSVRAQLDYLQYRSPDGGRNVNE